MIIDNFKDKYSVNSLTKYLGCSRSGYYDWVNRDKPSHNKIDAYKAKYILQLYKERKTRGRRMIKMELKRKYDIHMSLGSVHRYMSILGIKAIIRRKRKMNSKSIKEKEDALNNLLNRDFKADRPNQKWVTDITYLPSTDGAEYLSAIKDLYDKSIIAYHISNKNDVELVINTLIKAFDSVGYNILDGLIIHSDRGYQYTSFEYNELLKVYGIKPSFSRLANPWDNAPMESFFSTLKTEELKQYKKRTIKTTRGIVDKAIYFYNNQRPQIKLKELTPNE